MKHIGTEKLDGAPVQHYGGPLSGGKAMDVWIGTDGYPVRTIVSTRADGSLTKLTTNYTDYGTRAAVQAPPAKDTFGIMELLKSLGQGLGRG